MKADLHCHTILSDGAMDIDQLMHYASRIHLDYIAIADHESTHSIPAALALGEELGLHVIPAVEIAARHKETGINVHLLCYYPADTKRLQKRLDKDLKLFSEEEIAARLYWKKYGIWQEAREKDYRMKLVFLQFGPLEEQLLLWGLQNNIFSPGQELEYHIFGETGRFRAIYHELDHMEDRIIYHEEPWYEAQALLLEADRIFVCDTTGVLSDLLYALPQKRVHVLADGRDVACYEEQSRLVVFNWKQEALTVEHILDEALLVRAKHINLRYAHLYSGVEETKQNLEDQWNQLDAFTRYSNISAADYHEVRLQMIEDWKQETGKQEPDEEYLRYLAELEHIRWNRW